MDYYTMETMIEDLKALIRNKESELAVLQNNVTSDVNQAVKMFQLIHEINELKMQVQYHENLVADQMMKTYMNCSGCCCRKSAFY